MRWNNAYQFSYILGWGFAQQYIFDMPFDILGYHQIKAALVPDIWNTTQKTSAAKPTLHPNYQNINVNTY